MACNDGMKPLPLRTYVWPADKTLPVYETVFLPEAVYAEAMRALVIVCSDIVPFSRNPDTLWLARRNHLPMNEWWLIGGRWQLGEDPLLAAQRHFQRDAGALVPASRLILLGIHNLHAHGRQQDPQELPSQTLAFIFGIEVGAAEIAHMQRALGPPEYVAQSLTAVDWQALQSDEFHPSLRDLYKQIFSRG